MEPMRFLIEQVEAANRIDGKLLSGRIDKGESIVLAPSGQQSTILTINSDGKQLDSCQDQDLEIRLELTYAVKARIGDIIAPADARPDYADQFEARLHWLGEAELLPGRTYSLVAAGGTSEATVSKLKYRLEGSDDQHMAAYTLQRGERGVGNLALTRPICFDSLSNCVATARFKLLDKADGSAVAEGEIRHGLRRASNVHWQALDVDKQTRASIKQQTPRIVWLTGLSGSGKSTIANLLEKKLIARSRHSYLLDGDNVRHGLNKDLGFTDADRVENIRRVAETAKLMVDAGLIVITSFISPFRAERSMARSLFESGEFFEVFVDAPLDVCEQRDPKGLYKKARAGEIANFTGLGSPYEEPENPDMVIDTTEVTVEQAADRIMNLLEVD